MPVTRQQLTHALRSGAPIQLPAAAIAGRSARFPPIGFIDPVEEAGPDHWTDPEDLVRVIRDVSDPHPHGLRLHGVTITGDLDLSGLEIPFPLVMRGVHFRGPLLLRNAQTRTLDLEQSVLHGGLEGRNLRIQGDLLGKNLVSVAEIDLFCSVVTGQVQLANAALLGAENCFSGDAMTVGGGLICPGLRAYGTVRLEHSSVNVKFNLDNARLRGPIVPDSIDPGCGGPGHSESLVAEGMRLAGSLLGRGLEAHGNVQLMSAEIEGALLLSSTKFLGSGAYLGASRLHVRQDLDAQKLTSSGGVDLSGARIDGQLLLRGARLKGADAHLSAFRLHVDGDMFCRHLHADGVIRLSGAVINRQLDLRDVVLADTSGMVAETLRVGKDMTCNRMHAPKIDLRLRSAVVGGILDLEDAHIGSLDGEDLRVDGSLILKPASLRPPVMITLTRARIGSLAVGDTSESWPELGKVDGWRLGGVSPSLSGSKDAAQWLSTGGRSQPFQEMARVFDADGHPSAAKWLRYRSAVNSSANVDLLPRAGRLVYRATTGLGFYPGITLVWLVLIFLAALGLGVAHQDDFTTVSTPVIATALESDTRLTPEERSAGMVKASWWSPEWNVGEFSAVRHALSIAVPVTDLGGTEPWSPPTTWVWYVFSLLKGLAWIFTTLLLAGISGLLRRST